MKDDIAGFVMLEPASAANAANAAAALQRCCNTLGVPSALVSETATQFKRHLLANITTILHVDHRFSAETSPWTNGTVENVMKAILRMLKALLVEYRIAVTGWEHFVPIARWPLAHRIARVSDARRTRLGLVVSRQPFLRLWSATNTQSWMWSLSPMTLSEPWSEIWLLLWMSCTNR